MNKEEFKKEFSGWYYNHQHYYNNKHEARAAIEDWWLGKLDAYQSSLQERIEGIKIKEGEKYGVPTVVPDGGKIAALQDSAAVVAHNAALISVINLIKEGRE